MAVATDRIVLRVAPELKAEWEQLAATERRTLSNWIIARIEDWRAQQRRNEYMLDQEVPGVTGHAA